MTWKYKRAEFRILYWTAQPLSETFPKVAEEVTWQFGWLLVVEKTGFQRLACLYLPEFKANL